MIIFCIVTKYKGDEFPLTWVLPHLSVNSTSPALRPWMKYSGHRSSGHCR